MMLARVLFVAFVLGSLAAPPLVGQQLPREVGYRDPTLATLLSVTLPGGGQIYARETNKGIGLLALGVGAPAVGYLASGCGDASSSCERSRFHIGAAVGVIAWLYGMVDASASAERANVRSGLVLRYPEPEPRRNAFGVRRRAGSGVQTMGTGQPAPTHEVPAPTAVREARPGQALWVTIPGARSYYWHDCDIARRLPADRLIRFGTEEEARAAGFEPPTHFPQCQGPSRRP